MNESGNEMREVSVHGRCFNTKYMRGSELLYYTRPVVNFAHLERCDITPQSIIIFFNYYYQNMAK